MIADKHIAELAQCNICPRNCNADRYRSAGFCGANHRLRVNLSQLHHGEEPPISGTKGSGTIFFSYCNLKCVFCQNYTISSKGWGDDCSIAELAEVMLKLQASGAHNINLVTPTHYSPQLLDSLSLAKSKGLSIPIVWNSNAYEKVETLETMQGLVDIYLPDMKYAHPVYSRKYSFAIDYPEISRKAVKKMCDQVGNLHYDESGVATKGVLIRLLVLPKGLAGIEDTLQWIASELGLSANLSIMAQYYPTHKAKDFPELSRGINTDEYQKVLDKVFYLGFENVYTQELSSTADWTPRFINTSGEE